MGAGAASLMQVMYKASRYPEQLMCMTMIDAWRPARNAPCRRARTRLDDCYSLQPTVLRCAVLLGLMFMHQQTETELACCGQVRTYE